MNTLKHSLRALAGVVAAGVLVGVGLVLRAVLSLLGAAS